MNRQQAIHTATSRGIDFLHKNQLPDGTFPTFIYTQAEDIPATTALPTIVIPAHILSALSYLPKNANTRAICAALSQWLQAQYTHEQGFPYEPADMPYAEKPLPANLFSTFCALDSLQSHNPSTVTPAMLGSVANLLISSESRPGGPYLSTPPSASVHQQEYHIDIALNCIIAHFIEGVAAPLPNVIAYIAQTIGRQAFASHRHPSILPVLYHITRAYQGPLTAHIRDQLFAAMHDGHWDSPHDTALALAALAHLQVSAPWPAIAYLLETQRKDGSWTGQACYNTPDKLAIGAPSLTTAIALQALTMHTAQPTTQPSTQPSRRPTDRSSVIYQEAVTAVDQQLKSLDMPLRGYAAAMFKRIQQADTNREIVLLGYLFAQSLAKPSITPNDHFYTTLGIANIYNWMAYTIYDDFLDNEGNPHFLSVANVALRYSTHHFRKALPKRPGFIKRTAALFDTVDEANAWEIEHCRFTVQDSSITLGTLPDYGDGARLADRSCTHSLPVLAVLANQSLPPTSNAAIAYYTAFRHYLIARQLNDDMHDWEEDIRRGHISFVVAAILKQLQPSPRTLPLTELIPAMRQQFWDHTLADMCAHITTHTRQGRTVAKQGALLNKLHIIEQLLSSLDQVVERSLKERDGANEFLEAYKTPVKDPQ